MTKTPDAQAPSPDEAASENTPPQDTAVQDPASSDAGGTAQTPGDTAAGRAAAGADNPEGAHRRAVTAGTAPAIDRSRRPLPGGAGRAAGGGTAASPSGGLLQSADRRGILMGLLTAGAAVVVGSVIGNRGQGGTTQDVAPTGNTVNATIKVQGMRFVPDTVDVTPGDRLVITLDNTADQVHDLVLATGQTTGRIAAGAKGRLEVDVVPGPIEGWCSIAGHRAQGMVFHVTAGGTVAGAHQHGSGQSKQAGSGKDAVPDYSARLPADFKAFDAALPPAPTSPDGGPMTHRHTFTVKEQVMQVGAGVTQRRMTFNGQVPGPVLRGKVGDTFEITLVNDGTMSHSLDFHAGITPPDQAMRSINPGESLVYTFKAQHSGIWLYHCSTSPMSLHLASGMHGAVIIDPPGLPAVDREYVIVASEVYLGPEGGEPNTDKIAAKTPDLMTFNGVAFQYRQQPLKAKVGERVRFWVMAAGPSLPTSFHTVGLQFDQVFFEGAWTLGGPSRIGAAWSGGSQALGLQPAQGGFVECVASEPGHYVFVTHSFADMEKGAHGVLEVSA
ncbi:multicopper oxidase domain-containing protein [Actinomyces oris]|uniref:Copper-containing nitrite reductase n=2 Tax=Actinomyces oris TaxID=544580 RepID=A0AAW9KRY5_9ACTO|nr:multicopper oxidase domain-containing protein [Actinomyces oris]MEA1305992.1 multicopper oxidase domain-containing protein [Actinomyces oris]